MKYFREIALAVAISTTAIPSSFAATPVDFSQLVQNVTPSVVIIKVTKKLTQDEIMQQQMPDLLRRFFGPNVQVPNQRVPQEQSAFGSGFFISKDGYILTNHHVINNANKVTIVFNDRRELDAELVGSDARTDVAVLKVKGNSFPALKIGNPDELKVGEPVLAIGAPFGFDYSASAGIVSAKNRTMQQELGTQLIQTDAALNPGNSGGPLFNQKGEVVGVNSQIFSGTGGYMGLSFSIPIDVAMDVAGQIMTSGKVSRAYLGVMLQDIDRDLAESFNLSRPEGALITQVSPDTAASKAGLKTDDIIRAYNGNHIGRRADLVNYINRARPNQSATLTVQRNEKPVSVNITFASAPDDTPAAESMKTNEGKGPSLGMQLRDLTPVERERLNISGVVIADISATGLAARAGLLPNDVITKINGKNVSGSEDFVKIIRALPTNKVARVSIMRGNSPIILPLRIE